MLGNFKYSNPTKLYFGEDSLSNLKEELAGYGKNVQLVYGGGSIKKNGIYNQVVTDLKECGKEIFEDGGVMPNPTVEKLAEGCRITRDNQVDFILAVGGGSVCDYSKAVSVSTYCEDDPWEKYYIRFEDVTCRTIPVGCVLTMVGTGSEMNGGAVITNHEVHMLGQAVGAHTDATHGMTLSAVSIPYYKYIMADGLQKFKRYAVNVWDVNPAGKTEEQIALEGLECMENYMKEIGLVMNISELGVTKDMIEVVADSTLVMEGGYRVLTHEDIVNVLTASL